MRLNKFNYQEKIGFAVSSLTALYVLPTTVEGAVISHTTPLNLNANAASGTKIYWDIDGDGNKDLVLTKSSGIYLDTSDTMGGSTLGALSGRGMVQFGGQNGDKVRNLATGFSVGATLAAGYKWGDSQQTARTMVNTSGSSLGGDATINDGNWNAAGGQHYIGFRFNISGNMHYGWAEINLDLSGAPGGVTITQWAYESTAGTAIQIPGGSTPTSAPIDSTILTTLTGLSLLGLGAAGLRRRRMLKLAKTVNLQ